MLIPKNKTKKENVKMLYLSILKRVGKKDTTYENIKMLISKEDFVNFVLKDKEYNRLYKLWKDNDFDSTLSPTVDKIKNDKHYILNNIQILSKSKNSKKGNKTAEELRKRAILDESKMKKYLKEKRNEIIHKLKDAGYNNQYIGEIFNIDRSTITRIPKPLSDKKYFEKLRKELDEL